MKKQKNDVVFQCLNCMNDKQPNGEAMTSNNKICPKCGGKVVKFVCIAKSVMRGNK